MFYVLGEIFMLAYVFSVLAAVGVVAIAALSFRLAGKGSDDHAADGPSAGHAGAMLSALFLLVFAIAIIVPWTTADAARQNTHAESRAAIDAYWAAADLPADAVAPVRTGLRDYVTFVVKDEWPVMGHGEMHAAGSARLDELRARVVELDGGTEDQQEARGAVLDRIGAISAARAQRASDAAATPPEGLLLLTILTGLVVVVFPFLAGARPRGAALLPLAAMAAMLGFGIYLTWDISYAFAGPLAVGPEAFSGALQEFARIAGGV
ncbi:bestrophin-like domain [Nonomuraea sp. LPB2021202275-12-8]|uniref:bestrophin-like domain n=1 Tax=Nonomuraea sp. LPB2021202275-12-8 TaxID=3120159 RepID=UPI00300C7CF0